MKNELKNIMERPKKYDNIDGTGEMFMGLMILGFGLIGYLETVLKEHSIWSYGIPSMFFMYVVLIPVLALGYWVRHLIKKRITWPRTGYVALWPRTRSDEGKYGRLFIILLCAIVAGALGYLVARNLHAVPNLFRAGYLTIWALTYAFWVFFMERQHPWKWLVLLIMALGLLLLGLRVPGGLFHLFWVVCLFVGLMWIMSGGVTLFSYLRHTQPPVGEVE